MALTSGLSLAWSGDFNSLKEFICKTCDFVGNWSQPGDKKVFSFNDDSSISWRKSKKVLSFNGPQASQLMRDLCKRLSEQEAYTSDFADEHSVENAGQSSKSVDIDMEIEDLKAGQGWTTFGSYVDTCTTGEITQRFSMSRYSNSLPSSLFG